MICVFDVFKQNFISIIILQHRVKYVQVLFTYTKQLIPFIT